MRGPCSPSKNDAAAPLLAEIQRSIRISGPLSVAEYMRFCLNHPRYGYYRNTDLQDTQIGTAGDFITAPEVSQIFGELLGLWCVAQWQEMGSPDSVRLVELGPGRGTLMSDMLRAAAVSPAFTAALSVHLVEVSPALQSLQRQRLAGRPITWSDTLADVPEDGPALIVANEFFDCLPVHQFEFTETGWRERLIASSGSGLQIVLSAASQSPDTVLSQTSPPATGDIVEVSPARVAIAQQIAARALRMPTSFLTLDYGHDGADFGNSLQAVRRHRRAGALEQPGLADLTSLVDFAALVDAVRKTGAAAFGPVGQGRFLQALGYIPRAEALAAGVTPEKRKTISQAADRLLSDQQMGKLFKVIAIQSPDLPSPPGFEPS